MKHFITWLVFSLASTATASEPLRLEHHASALVPTNGPIFEMLIIDPRVVAVVPLSNNQFHLQAVGPGETTVTANLHDGRSTRFDVEVSKKRYGGKSDFRLSRGRGLMLHFPSSVTYVGVGDPNLVNITHLENHQRYFLVGLNEGKTNLVVVNDQGVQESVIEVGKKIDDESRTHVSIEPGKKSLHVLSNRPTNLVVANKQIASAKLHRTKDGKYGVTISALSPGKTDILLSMGLESRPVWYTVHVE